MAVITFKALPVYKKALNLVAADQGTTVSELLRSAVHTIVTTHDDGVFFDRAARDFEQNEQEIAQTDADTDSQE